VLVARTDAHLRHVHVHHEDVPYARIVVPDATPRYPAAIEIEVLARVRQKPEDLTRRALIRGDTVIGSYWPGMIGPLRGGQAIRGRSDGRDLDSSLGTDLPRRAGCAART